MSDSHLTKRATSFIISQYADESYWDSYYSEALKESSAKSVGDAMVRRLKDSGISLTEFYIILHDKDEELDYDESSDEYTTTSKRNHYHVVMRTKARNSIFTLSKALGISGQFIQTIHAGKYSYNNSLAYLIHAKENPDEKHIYSPEEVETVVGTPYEEIYEKYRKSWKIGRERKQSLIESEEVKVSTNSFELPDSPYKTLDKHEIAACLIDGSLDMDEIFSDPYLLAMYEDYEEYFERILRNRAMSSSERMIRNYFRDDRYEFNQFYIYGPARVGKTSAIKKFFEKLNRCTYDLFGVSWRYFSCGDREILDGYDGEEATWMDELRGDSISLNSFLNITGGANKSIYSRYHNRRYEARLNIISNNQSPIIFFDCMDTENINKRYEDPYAFFGRMNLIFEVLSGASYGRMMEDKVVRFFTYNEIYRDELENLIPNLRLIERESEYDGMTEYAYDELISFDQMIDLMLYIIRCRTMIPMIRDIGSDKFLVGEDTSERSYRMLEASNLI